MQPTAVLESERGEEVNPIPIRFRVRVRFSLEASMQTVGLPGTSRELTAVYCVADMEKTHPGMWH